MLIIGVFLASVGLNAQYNIEQDYSVCKEYFLLKLRRLNKENLVQQIRFNKELSYAYYTDFDSAQHYIVKYNSSDSIKIVPYQYTLWYNIFDKDDNILKSFRVECRRYDKELRLDKFEGLKDFLEPVVKVVERKVISLEKALDIAKDNGYEITTWEIDYEKKEDSNDYKTFFPRLIWTLKGQKINGGIKVIQINAKNGRVIKEYQEFSL